MRLPKLLFALSLCWAVASSCSDNPTGVPDAGQVDAHFSADGLVSDAPGDASPAGFAVTWKAEPGFVVEDASNAGAKVDSDGSVLLLYEDRSKSQPGISQRVVRLVKASDWLTPTEDVTLEKQAFHAIQLPSGLYRAYGGNPTIGGGAMDFGSWTSTDGVTFVQDLDDKGAPIVRYQLQPEDKGKMGTFDVFVNSDKHVVLLYVADNQAGGKNNIRRAISTDGGDSFAFDRGNVLDDDKVGGGGGTYVDQDTLVLPDGRVYLIAMKGGTIHHFIGDDKGDVFVELSESALFTGAMFEPINGTTAFSLHDPQIVMLTDGRLRIYMACQIQGETGPDGHGKHYMVAATSGAI